MIDSSSFHIISSLIDNDYIFIDLPYYSNIGDTLIWQGTEDFLKRIPYKCLLRASFHTFHYPKLKPPINIIMMGGGNWGDLYLPHNILRKNVVRQYPDNNIIILPQTVFYEGARNARSDASIFRQHKHLTICARDRYSYRFLKAFGFSKNVILIPDMAFCIAQERLKKDATPTLHKDLLFKRIDKEESDVEIITSISSCYDTSDWPLYEGKDPKLDYLFNLMQNGNHKAADDYALSTYLPSRIKTGIEFISQYDRVISNRLHGAILSILLGKEVYIIDNSYGKNSQYYDTWLSDIKNVHILTSSKRLNYDRKLRFLSYWLLSVGDRIKERIHGFYNNTSL